MNYQIITPFKKSLGPFKNILIFNFYEIICVGVRGVGDMVGVPAEAGEGIASTGAGASEGCETPNVGAGTKFRRAASPLGG